MNEGRQVGHGSGFAALLAGVLMLLGLSTQLLASITIGGDLDPDPPVTDQPLIVGNTAPGFMFILGGNVLRTRDATVGNDGSGFGDVSVGGLSIWEISGDLFLGLYGNGQLAITGGGMVTNYTGVMASQAGSEGSAIISGLGTHWANLFNIMVGGMGQASLTISEGAMVSGTSAYMGVDDIGQAMVTVTDTFSHLNLSQSLSVGDKGIGTLHILDGGQVSSHGGGVGRQPGAVGTVLVSGADAIWSSGDYLILGGDTLHGPAGGSATLAVRDGGQVTVDGTLMIHGPGRLEGNARVAAAVISAGTVAPDIAGALLIDGDFTQQAAGTLLLEIAGVAVDQYATLEVTGTAFLGGTLQVHLNEYVPSPGDQFTLLIHDVLVNQGYSFDFSQASLPSHLAWSTTGFATTGTITVVPEPALSAWLLVLACVLGRRPRRCG